MDRDESFEFVVVNYSDSGTVTERRRTGDMHQAYSWAYETPHSSVTKNDFRTGGTPADAHFSPKHPLWSRETFLKGARSRGRAATRKTQWPDSFAADRAHRRARER